LASESTVGKNEAITSPALGLAERASFIGTCSTELVLLFSALLSCWQKDEFPHQEFSQKAIPKK